MSLKPLSSKKKIQIIIITIFVLFLGWRGYREVIPSGASLAPFILARTQGPSIQNPDKTVTLQVWFNDAGGAHSGNHWTWFVESHFLLGKRVVAQGYLGSEQAVSGKKIPLKWEDNHSLTIMFLSERHDSAQEKKVIKLK